MASSRVISANQFVFVNIENRLCGWEGCDRSGQVLGHHGFRLRLVDGFRHSDVPRASAEHAVLQAR